MEYRKNRRSYPIPKVSSQFRFTCETDYAVDEARFSLSWIMHNEVRIPACSEASTRRHDSPIEESYLKLTFSFINGSTAQELGRSFTNGLGHNVLITPPTSVQPKNLRICFPFSDYT